MHQAQDKGVEGYPGIGIGPQLKRLGFLLAVSQQRLQTMWVNTWHMRTNTEMDIKTHLRSTNASVEALTGKASMRQRRPGVMHLDALQPL